MMTKFALKTMVVAVVCLGWLIWGVSPALAAPCTGYEPEPFIPVAQVEAFAGDSQSAAVSTAFAIALQAKVTGPCGELLSGLTVTFTAPSSGASATFPNGASAVTNAQGIATVNVNANGTAGTYTVTATTAGIPGTFTLTNSGSSLTAQTIAFGALGGQSYGAAAFGISATATSGLAVSFASTTSPVCTASGAVVTIVAAGLCSITASQAGNASYSAAPNVIQSFMVSKATLIVTAQNATIAYPAAPAFSANITGFVNSDPSTVVTGSPAFVNGAPTTSGKPNAGTWSITPSGGTLAASNYAFSFAAGALTVNPAALSITASNQTIAYGTAANLAAGGGTVMVTGLVNGDSGTPGLSTNATVSFTFPNAGTWNIIPAAGTIPAGNYTITVNNGALTVNKLTISVTAKPQTITYGNPANLAAGPGTVTVATLVTGDTGAPSLSTNATLTNGNANATNGMPWTIAPSAGTISTSNYTISFNNGSLTVNVSPLTVTARNAGKAYGTTFAGSAFTTGLLSGDSVSGLTLSSSGAAGAAAVAGSPYSIVPSAAVGTGLANYAISYVDGTLTVNRAALTVTAGNASRAYGAVNPTLSAVIAGIVNGETSEVVTGAPALSTTAALLSPAGAYPITPAIGTLSAANYTFGFVNGTLTVMGTLTVAANSASKIYGAALTLAGTGFTHSTLMEGDAVTSVTLTSSGAAAAAGVAGSPYSIVPSAAVGTGLGNYTINYTNGSLAVNPATLTVTANNASKVYGAPLPTFGDAITGFVNGDASAAAGTPNLTTTATAASAIGTYPITVSGTPASANYTFAFVNGTLTISKASTSIVLTSSAMLVSAAIVATPPGAGIPTGTVQFLRGATVLGTVALAGPTASLTVPAGTVTAVYSGDGNFIGSTSSSVTVYTAPSSSISLTSSVNPSSLGQAVTFTVSVSASGPNAGPSGSVQFLDGAKLLGSVNLSGASASYATATLDGGSHTIVAQYSGDNTFPAAQASYGQFVNAAATLSLAAAPAASVYGQPVVLTATVGPTTAPPGFAPPTGQVSFSTGGASPLASGTASVTVTNLPVGTDSITAQYNGDSAWPSASGAGSVTVTQASTTAALSLTMVSGQLALVAVVTPVAPGAGTPTGIVQFVNTSNNTMVASAGLSGGNATASVSATITGLPIMAVYGGDANFKGSASAMLPAVVNAATNLSTTFAPDEVASLFNVTGLGGNISATLPLTTSLGGVTVRVADSAGVARQAELYGVFVSAGQINFVVPSATASGPAIVTITLPGGATVTTVIQVGLAAPGIFTANMNGQGAYAGQVVYASQDGSQIIASSAVMNPATNQYAPNPIGLNTPGQQAYLVLYGTGLRHAGSLTAAINGVNLPLFFFGAQGQDPGLDQINLQVPNILAGSGLVNLVITVGGQAANTVAVVVE
jgi:uncharacterized protein (TIGR03437 family)